MFQSFDGQTADEVWCAIAQHCVVQHDSVSRVQPSRVGDTVETLHATVSIADPRQRWVVSRVPPINPAFALAEIIWIMCGRRDSKFLTYFNRQLPKFAGDGPIFHGAYGHRLRHSIGIDQLERAYHVLRQDCDSRQVVLQIWDGRIDMPDARGRPPAADIPCNLMSVLKVREGTLEWLQVLRSNDVFRGLPYNFVQFTSLQEIVAGWLGLSIGSYNQVSDSLHAYVETMDDLTKTVPIEIAQNTDSLALPFDDSRSVFSELADCVDQMIDARLTQGLLKKIARWTGPRSYQHMLLVMGAEVARRHKWDELQNTFIDKCDNPIYRQLWQRWVDRLIAVRT